MFGSYSIEAILSVSPPPHQRGEPIAWGSITSHFQQYSIEVATVGFVTLSGSKRELINIEGTGGNFDYSWPLKAKGCASMRDDIASCMLRAYLEVLTSN